MSRSAFSRPGLTRRGLLLGTAAVGAGTALTACSFDKTPSTGASSGGAAGGSTVKAVYMNCFGNKPTYVKNFNPVSPAEGVLGAAFLYDHLMWLDRPSGNVVKPWLAKEFTFDRAAGTLDLTLREDAKWSDGKPITADDVIYTMVGMPAQAKKQGATVEEYSFTAKKTGNLTVQVSWPKGKVDPIGDQTVAKVMVKPKHVYEKEDLGKFTNADNPVTSSPLTLERYTPQQVTFKVREDHWMGKFDHVKEVNWVSYGSSEIARNLFAQGKLDWATMSLQNPDQWVQKNPGSKYWTVYANNAESLIFNCDKAPFNDPAVRNAIYAALDTDKMHSLFDIGLPSINPTGLDPEVWKDWVNPDYTEPHKADVAKAKKYLADAGWTVTGGKLTKDGKSYAVNYKTVADYTNWATWADGLRDQLKQALGLDVNVLKVPDAQIWDQVNAGDYDMAMSWCANGTHMSQVYASLNSSGYMPIGKDATVNFQRVRDAELDKLLNQAAEEMDEAKLKSLGHQIQKHVVEKCYFAPLNPGANFAEATGKNWKGWPDEVKAGVVPPLAYGTPDTWKVLQKLQPAR